MINTWYFGFHRPSTLAEVWRGEANWYSLFGHVEAFGFTIDDTWLFFDPQGRRTRIHVEHRHDAVEALMAERWAACDAIYRIDPREGVIHFPLHPTMNCVSQCAALLGWVAYTPRAFRRKLRRNGAELIHGATRRSSTESRQGA